MVLLRSIVSTAVALLAAATVSVDVRAVRAADIDPNDKGDPLFPDGHPNVTYFTDDNWDEIMAQHNDKPWLVDFYHPFCPHCKHFVPAYTEIAAYYKVEGSINIGAISCMDHVKCRRVGIKGFPTLIAYNFDKKRPGKEVWRVVGTHTVQEVKDHVNRLFLEAKINETGTTPPPTQGPEGAPVPVPTEAANAPAEETAKPGEQVRKEIWEESTKPMNQTTRLQDAGSAFIFGLKQGVFMGRELLEDLELDALKAWLALVSQTFPGSINRRIIKKLHDKLEPIALLDFDLWDKMVKDWQAMSVFDFAAEEAKLDFSRVAEPVPEWQRLSNLFVGQGVTYRACALYTCGQWNMFHMLTMNPLGHRDDHLMVSVIATMRRFMKHFFGCVQCRDHFLEYNNLDMVKKINAAENKALALKRWLWEMHNAVNKRIRHPLWPKPDICPTCGHEDNWVEVEVDKWLGNTYVYREIDVPVAQATTQPPATPRSEGGLRKEPAVVVTKRVDPEVWKPKDADLGIDNPAQKVHQEQQLHVEPLHADANVQHAVHHKEVLQGQRAPPVSLFAWYILPVFAVGGYLLFVRSRQRPSFRH
ncbi:hypothetical protein PINS_up016746 [Pythium insidiosum]|nr:hypothetical protein PINS_up016746 [Pythium insidiosum]